MSDEPFDDKEDQTTIHRKEDTLESLPNTVSSKTRSLSGQDQSLDDETISYYNRWVIHKYRCKQAYIVKCLSWDLNEFHVILTVSILVK